MARWEPQPGQGSPVSILSGHRGNQPLEEGSKKKYSTPIPAMANGTSTTNAFFNADVFFNAKDFPQRYQFSPESSERFFHSS